MRGFTYWFWIWAYIRDIPMGKPHPGLKVEHFLPFEWILEMHLKWPVQLNLSQSIVVTYIPMQYLKLNETPTIISFVRLFILFEVFSSQTFVSLCDYIEKKL